MYFETIHDLPCFDEIGPGPGPRDDGGGYTSYWETDTEVDSDFGNFIFNNVAGDSASLICLEDTVDLIQRRQQQHEEGHTPKPPPTYPPQQQQRQLAHYKLEQGGLSSPASSPSVDHPLEMSLESRQSAGTGSHHSSSRMSRGVAMSSSDTPPPVPPPRRVSSTAAELLDHTYETLDDCKGEYLAHHQHLQQQDIYFSKASDDSRGSQDSAPQPVVSNEGADFMHSSHCKRAESASARSPTGSKPRSASLQLPKSPECGCEAYRMRRKNSEPSSHNGGNGSSRKSRRQEKVASKGSCYPPPIRGFPMGVPEDYVDYLANTTSVCPSSAERRSPGMCTPPSPGPVASPGQQRGLPETPERKSGSAGEKVRKTAPLVIKHKGKTYLVPVVDKKLQRELEKKSKAENPSVTMRQCPVTAGQMVSRCSGGSGNGMAPAGNVPSRSFASPPKVDPTDHASSHKRRNSAKVVGSSPQKVPSSKQVTLYGVL